MPISAEVLSATIEELLPRLEMTFWRWSPLLDKFYKAERIKKDSPSGPFRKFRLMTGAPGQATPVIYGTESLSSPRRDTVTTGTVYGGRVIYHFKVPGKEMAEVNTDDDVDNIIEQYPIAGLQDMHIGMTKQLLIGNQAQYNNLVTFNGAAQYDSDSGASRDGIFSFSDPGSQSTPAYGVTKKGGTGGVADWYNGFASINSMGDDGQSKIRREMYRAGRAHPSYGTPDCLIADETSYNNYVDMRDDRVITLNQFTGAEGSDNGHEGIHVSKSAVMYLEEYLDIDNATVVAQNGIIYGLNTKAWTYMVIGKDSEREGKGWFEIRKPLRMPDEEAWKWEIVFHGNPYTTNLNSNFVIVGGHQE